METVKRLQSVQQELPKQAARGLQLARMLGQQVRLLKKQEISIAVVGKFHGGVHSFQMMQKGSHSVKVFPSGCDCLSRKVLPSFT